MKGYDYMLVEPPGEDHEAEELDTFGAQGYRVVGIFSDDYVLMERVVKTKKPKKDKDSEEDSGSGSDVEEPETG